MAAWRPPRREREREKLVQRGLRQELTPDGGIGRTVDQVSPEEPARMRQVQEDGIDVMI